MRAYEITYKKSPRAHKIYKVTRFANDSTSAEAQAKKVLDEEYYGEAVLIAVQETKDPR